LRGPVVWSGDPVAVGSPPFPAFTSLLPHHLEPDCSTELRRFSRIHLLVFRGSFFLKLFTGRHRVGASAPTPFSAANKIYRASQRRPKERQKFRIFLRSTFIGPFFFFCTLPPLSPRLTVKMRNDLALNLMFGLDKSTTVGFHISFFSFFLLVWKLFPSKGGFFLFLWLVILFGLRSFPRPLFS